MFTIVHNRDAAPTHSAAARVLLIDAGRYDNGITTAPPRVTFLHGSSRCSPAQRNNTRNVKQPKTIQPVLYDGSLALCGSTPEPSQTAAAAASDDERERAKRKQRSRERPLRVRRPCYAGRPLGSRRRAARISAARE